MKIDITKKYQTRDGRAVRIYAVDGGNSYSPHSVHGAVQQLNWGWEICSWTSIGGHCADRNCEFDLVEIRPEHTVWVNIYAEHLLPSARGWYNVKESKAMADHESAAGERIACIPITFREGDGLVPKD